MKFIVPNYSCLQNPWLGGYRPPNPRSLCPQLNLLNPPPRTKFLGTPLAKWKELRLKTEVRTPVAGAESCCREIWIVNISPVGRFVEFQKCVLRDESGSAHDMPRFLTSRSASSCPFVVAVSPAGMKSIVVPSAANITGQILELGNWGKIVTEHLKESEIWTSICKRS